MPLGECMSRISHREYLAWMDWLDSQWNKPGLLEHYLMQLTKVVASMLHPRPETITIAQFKLNFVKSKQKPVKPLTVEEATKLAKARWYGILGRKVKDERNRS